VEAAKRQRLKRAWRRVGPPAASLVVLALVGLGVYGVAEVTDTLITILAGIAAIGLLALRFSHWRSLPAQIVRVLAAAYVSLLALTGLDVIVNFVFDARIEIWIGLIVALIAFGLVSLWYLAEVPSTVKIRGHQLPLRLGLAVAIAVVCILVVPLVYGLASTSSSRVPSATTPVASKLDLRIVGDGQPLPAPPELPQTPLLDEFDVTYSVGYAAGDRVHWTLVDGSDQEQALRAIAAGSGAPTAPSAPAERPDADHVLLLLVDGTPPVVEDPAALPDRPAQPGEVARWRRIARSAGGGGTGTYALLQTSDRGRIEAWNGFVRNGEAVPEQALASQTATDAGARLEVSAPNSQADFALAMAYRPILLFDKDEPVPWPLSVSGLFAAGDVSLCHDQGALTSECKKVERPRELESGGTHLQLVRPSSAALRRHAREELLREEGELEAAQAPLARAVPEGTPAPSAVPEATPLPPVGAGSAIYVNPVEVGRRLYLDYWWYLPDNPVKLGGGALCGAGLVIADVTCPSHESDWEGMTVVVGLGGRVPRVVAVQYAQHAGVVRYGWGLLRRRWDSSPYLAKLTAGIADAATRPIAFSAAGTHATYPTACTGDCQQVENSDLREEAHDGKLAWVGDFTAACGHASCLQLLPTHDRGRRPALWNAYDGTWGDRHCILSYYCNSASPPTAPGTQRRYREPSRVTGVVTGTNWTFHPVEDEG